MNTKKKIMIIDGNSIILNDYHNILAGEQSNIYKMIMDSLTEGILVINKENQIVFFNSAASKMLSLDSEFDAGKQADEIINNIDLINIIEKGFGYDELSRDKILSEEIEIELPDKKTFLVKLSKLKDEIGQELGVVAILHDITVLKETSQINSQFLRMVTHELRSPLSAIEGYLSAYLSRAAGRDPKDYWKMMERARQRANSLLSLIDDLLFYSRLNAKLVPKNKEPLNVSEIILDILELQKIEGVEKNLKFEIDLTEQMPLIDANRTEMEQLFTNLISNAIKYNLQDGKVMIKVRPDDNFLSITVADTGIGIDREGLPNIFDEFYRVCDPETRYLTGTGLGLSIVKRIVDLNSGHIAVESQKGKGSAFTVMLPIKQGEKAQ